MGRPRSNSPVAGDSVRSSRDLGEALASNERLRTLLERQLEDRESWQVERTRWEEERRLLRAMIDQVPDYLFVKDTECRFAIANEAVAADLGTGPEGILGKSDLELHPEELARRFLENDQKVLRSGIPILDNEEYIIRPSGEKRWLSTSKLPLRGADGTIIGLVGIARDITLRKQAEEQVRYLAYHDQLTGLPNRAAFEARLEGAARDDWWGVHLLLIDLDRFKHVNDTLGHAAGDDLLRQVGERLARLVAPRGFVARIGGDEFAILLFNEPHFVCDQIIESLSTPFRVVGKTAHVGASIGVARIEAGVSAMEALRQADIALYEAKGRGRRRWQLFETEMASSLERRHGLEEDLRAALRASDQVHAVYQPVFSVDGRGIVGAEALVRWQHPTAGLLLPASFIPIAEEAGLICELGDLMLRRSCELLARSDIPWIAVNVSTVQLHDPEFVERAMAAIRSAGIDASRIYLEITESVLLDDSGQAAKLLDDLRTAGFRVSLDDFGTGYSSLNYLRRFPIDKLKVDRSFVAQIGTRAADAIIEAILALARGLEMTVTAEGVETEAQRQFLEHAGCDEVQGYLLSRPIDSEGLLALRRGRKHSNQPADMAQGFASP